MQEFECGVQFEGTENSKQEWSFTLYDFDGHGRITKEVRLFGARIVSLLIIGRRRRVKRTRSLQEDQIVIRQL